MLIIADARLPKDAGTKLQSLGDVQLLATKNATYASISGHPDIYICQTPGGYLVAPNLPAETASAIKKAGHNIILGDQAVAATYPGSACYNAFVNNTFYIHHMRYTAAALRQSCIELSPIHVNQAYTRCNLTEAGGLYMTSDRGIQKTLEKLGLDTVYIDPRQIVLPGEKYGFFGGCTGIIDDTLLLLGSLNAFAEGRQLEHELAQRNIRIIELYDGPLFDGGSILLICKR